VSRKHLGWHGSLENYRTAKRRIFEYMDPDAVAVFNADDPTSVELLSNFNQPALTFGLRLPAEITAQVIEQRINEQTFVLSAGNDSVGVRSEIIGDHHVYNCLAAATMALAYGVKLPAIARGLERVARLPGRMERVMAGQEFAVLVDAADTADALRVCLRATRPATGGRLICVFGPHDDVDEAELSAMGRVIGAMADECVVTHGFPSYGSHRACMELRSGFADSRKARVIVDRTEAIALALNEARPGDTVMIAGMGDRRHTLSTMDEALMNDCEIARQILQEGFTEASHQRLAA
jgi:UDP-N-acetylmuramoyl-L-alanyl-D-glutamate--2,6-diaminopimelate ligase